MNPFLLINEVAVISTAFLMLAVSTIWYAPAFFGSLEEKNVTGTHKRPSEILLAICKVIAYTLGLFTLTYISAYRQVLDLSLFELSLLMCALVVPLIAVGSLASGRSLRLIAVDALFTVVFIVLGLYVVTFWPW